MSGPSSGETSREGVPASRLHGQRLAGGDLLRQAARMTLRDWRAGELTMLLLALVLAVAALSSVAFLSDRLHQGLERDTAHPAVVDPRVRPFCERLHRRIGARHQQPISDAAAVADQPGRRQIGGIEHQPRREIDECEAAIQLARDHRADLEVAAADFDGVADVHLQRIEQRLVDPYGARRRDRAHRVTGHAGRRRDTQCAAQRIAWRDRLDRGKPRQRRGRG